MLKSAVNFPYKDENIRYRLGKEDCDKFHTRQYFLVYRARVEQLRERIVKNAQKILGNDKLGISLIDYQKSNKGVLLVGIVFKKMKFRQSVLYEFADDSNLKLMHTKDGVDLTDDEDLLELENNQQMIKLAGNINKHLFVTGDVIGVFGSQERMEDVFNVEMVIFPEFTQQLPWPIIEQDCYVALISGICLSGDAEKCAKTCSALDNFFKWLNEEDKSISLEEGKDEIVQNVLRLVVAGDFARLNTIEIQLQQISTIGHNYEMDSQCFSQLGHFPFQFTKNLQVDLMPGANDPAQCTIPQQPIPKEVFTASASSKNADLSALHTVTNPYCFSLGALRFLGTSGQNINDLARLTRTTGALERMKRTLEMGILFPTVPDTLSGFPFGARDPLVLEEELPHFYFCGNQTKFEKNLLDFGDGKRCLIVAVPKFCETFEVVLLNLRTFDARTICFKESS